jgi:hypothetical protein
MHAPIMPYSDEYKDDARFRLLMQTYDCPKHGQYEFECHDSWTDSCNSAKYGFACPACGYIGTNIPSSDEEAHGALCCHNVICIADGETVHDCVTHGIYF